MLALACAGVPSAGRAQADAGEGSGTEATAPMVLECVMLPHEVVDVSSGAEGLIESVEVDRSDRIERGQVVAMLESSVESANLAVARTRAELDTQVRLHEAALSFDDRRRSRSTTLYERNVISSHDKDKADEAAVLRRYQLREARDRRRLAQLEQARAQALLALRTVRSPLAGVVLERFKSPGEYVEEEAIVRVARLDPLRVEVIAPLELHGSIRPGMRAEVDPETAAPREATVTMVDAVADPGSGTFRVRLELPNPGLELLAGSKCTARLLEGGADAAALAVHDPVAAPAGTAAALTPAAVDERRHAPVDAVLPAMVETRAEVVACLALGPVFERADAERLVQRLDAITTTARLRQEPVESSTGFIVVTPRLERDARRAAVRTLREGGVVDLALLPDGRFGNRVSLGVYSRRALAEARRRQIAGLGVEAEILPRTRADPAWWLDVATADPQAVAETVRATVPDLTPEPAGCETFVAART
jgi:RND family efflux transporter MFP subunit